MRAAEAGLAAGSVGAGQLERAGDAVGDGVGVRHAGRLFDDHGGENEVGVEVAPVLARLEVGRVGDGDLHQVLRGQLVEAVLQQLGRPVALEHALIQGVGEDAAGVVEQLPDGDLASVVAVATPAEPNHCCAPLRISVIMPG
ncbi:hypothetical protein Q9G87_45770 [Nonomuraea sp. G32]|nr:hypothetical protein [Nonomuraea sp. G32]MDP4509334.1 hypothetical protein [Nonomuraea sp. G32]